MSFSLHPACAGSQTLFSSLKQLYVGQMKVVIMGWHWAITHYLSGSLSWVLSRHKASSQQLARLQRLLDTFQINHLDTRVLTLTLSLQGMPVSFALGSLCRKYLKWAAREVMVNLVTHGFPHVFGGQMTPNGHFLWPQIFSILVSSCYLLSCLWIHIH